MASIKIASLLLKTLAKPMAAKIKLRAKDNGAFRERTIAMAQFLHRSEMNMRRRLLGEDHPLHIRPLNDAKAIDSGANFLSESFLFGFATILILAETWRSRRKEGKRRDFVADMLEQHEADLVALKEGLVLERAERDEGVKRERELEKIVEEIVGIGLRGGWLEGARSPDWEERAKGAGQRWEDRERGPGVVRKEIEKVEHEELMQDTLDGNHSP